MCFIIVLATFFSNQTKSKLIYASFTFTFFVLDFVARCQYHQTKYTFWGFIFFLWFFVCYISYIILFRFLPIFDRELSFSFVFFISLIGNFLFFFSFGFFQSLIGNFHFFFFCFWSVLAAQQWVTLLSWETPLFLSLRARMEILILGQGLWWFEVLAQKACRTAGRDVCQGVGFASNSGIRGMSLIISMTRMQQWWFRNLCKASQACTYADTQALSFGVVWH